MCNVNYYQKNIVIHSNTIKLNTLTFSVISSLQNILIFSTVAGASSLKCPVTPASSLAEYMAFLMAKKTEADKNSGGSPTA